MPKLLTVDSPNAEGNSSDVEALEATRLGTIGYAAIGWLVLVVIGALLAPVLPLDDPDEIAGVAREGPSLDHWFGTDGNGRDVFSRVVWAGRSSLLLGTGAVALGTVVGGSLGLVAGYFRGRLDRIVTGVFDVLLAVPALVLGLALVAMLADSEDASNVRRLVVLILALGIVAVPMVGRIARVNTLVCSQREFVVAARSLGATDWRILLREVLPNVVPAMVSVGLLGVGIVIVAEGGLSVLGVGVQLPTPSWGNIIAEGRTLLPLGEPHAVLYPTVVIFLTVLALNILGDIVVARFGVRGPEAA